VIIEWPTVEERYAIANAYRARFKVLEQQTGLVEDPAMVRDFPLLRGADLQSFTRFPPYQEVASHLRPVGELRGELCHFLSHRWLSPEHPDPDGKQLALLRQRMGPHDWCWVDYTCLPQRPRTPEEEALFRRSMRLLPSFMFGREFIVLRCRSDAYFERAWCYFELLAAHVLGRRISYIHEVPQATTVTHREEQQVLERTLLDGSLPPELEVTDPADREPLEQSTSTVATFSLLNLVSHYLALGQIVSDQEYFRGEDRYYFLATCGFRRMFLWLMEACRELGLGLFDLSRNEFDENIFVRIAKTSAFRHHVDIYAFPKEVTLDSARLHWLSEHRDRPDSATNLFYLVSAMITPLVDQQFAAPTQDACPDEASEAFASTVSDLDQVGRQQWGHPDRLSIELECSPHDPRPPEVFQMAIAGTDLTEHDFEDSGRTIFGRKEYLVRADPDAIGRYRAARPRIQERLREFYRRGLIRAATW
jgi:hypothetical protein